MRLVALLVSLALTACAGLPEKPPSAREALDSFSLEARFALRASDAEGKPQSSGGRLSWQRSAAQTHILIATPLGMGIAEIDARPGLATLQTGDNRRWEAETPDELIAIATGQNLPVARLSDWLLGRTRAGSLLERDALQRPLHLAEDGWEIDYSYDDERSDALPSRIALRKDSLELRLRIEQWKAMP